MDFHQDKLRHIKTPPFFSVVHAIEGQYEISIDNGRPVFTGEGRTFAARADVLQNIIHHTPSDNRPMKACWVFLDVRIGGVIDLFKFFDIPLIIGPDDSKPIRRIIGEVLSLQQCSDSILKHIRLHSLAFSLLEILLSHSTEKEFERILDKFARILPALELINSTENETLTISQLASSVNISEPRFHVIFKEVTGKAPCAYIRDHRLTLAGSLLLTGEKSLGEIASATGFYDQFHFCKAFKAKYGLSPLKYRKSFLQQHRQN